MHVETILFVSAVAGVVTGTLALILRQPKAVFGRIASGIAALWNRGR